MQFLVYLTVLMVSVSMVLLEVHWITSPPPQTQKVSRNAGATSVPKVEGPNAQLSPVYPTKADAAQANESGPSAQQAANNGAATNTTMQPSRKTAPETTGAAARSEQNSDNAAGVASPLSGDAVNTPPGLENEAVANNRCDIQACSSAYRSFRASDCTYQPFNGPRQFCAKPPASRTARDQREGHERRGWQRETSESDRRARSKTYFDDADGDERGFVFDPAFRW